MVPVLFLALVGVPVVEIALFIEIGGAIGTWATLAAIVLTAALGTLLLRSQGSGLMARARTTLDRGEMPVEEVIHGLFLLIAGLLLLTPGFFTDAIGFLLCVPPLRLALGRAILRRLRHRMTVHVSSRSGPGGPPPGEGAANPGARIPPDGDRDAHAKGPRAPDSDRKSDSHRGATRWRPPEDNDPL